VPSCPLGSPPLLFAAFEFDFSGGGTIGQRPTRLHGALRPPPPPYGVLLHRLVLQSMNLWAATPIGMPYCTVGRGCLRVNRLTLFVGFF
jgi:hypothetical protein